MLSFGSATGNLFNRLGKCGLLIKQMMLNQVAQFPNLVSVDTGLVAQFNAESDIQALIGSSYISQLNSDGIGGISQSVADQTINRMIFRDNPRINLTLTSSNTQACIFEIIRQMKVEQATILQLTVASTPVTVSNPGPHFTGNGNGILVTSTVRPSDGLILQNIFAEQVQALCTSDSYIGNAVAGNETITFTGTGGVGLFDFNWPLGSDASITFSAIDGSANNTSDNIMKNSGFDTWTVADTPNNWTIVTGTPGTNIFEEETIIYGSSGNAIRFLGDGATVINIKQQFDNSSTGTAGSLDPLTQYSVCLFMRRDGVAAAGTLVVDLIDGGNNVLMDANGTNNTFSIDLSTLSTNYAAYTGAFRTPLVLPAAMYIRLRQTVPYTSGRSFYLDRMGFGEMSQLGTHQVFLSAHSGSVNWTQGDWGSITNTNSRGLAGTLNTWQTLLYRMIPDVISSEIIFPYSSNPSISDNLIG